MKKYLLIFIGLWIMGTAFRPHSNLQNQKGPAIQFKSTIIDYGEIEKGSDGYRTFEFTNTGDAPLIINRVKSSCGCTVAEKPNQPIMPGKTGRIKVHYNTNHLGSFRKTVTVYTNAVNVPNGVVVLKIKGRVIDPNKVNLNRPKTNSPVFK